VQDTFSGLESQLKEMSNNDAKVLKQRNDLLELREVLFNASTFFSEVFLLVLLSAHASGRCRSQP
jgi:hypothetical protein